MALLEHRRQRTRSFGRPAPPFVRAALHDQRGRHGPRPLHVIWHRARTSRSAKLRGLPAGRGFHGQPAALLWLVVVQRHASLRLWPVRYLTEARALWKTYVPKIGQADTVQGELVRAVEKLRDEALRNGNVNWSKGHVILAEFVRDTLIG